MTKLPGVRFSRPDGRPGVRVTDAASGRQYAVRTAGPVDPEPVDAEAIPFPVSRAVAVETDAIRLPASTTTIPREADGEMIAWVGTEQSARVDTGDRYVELTTPVKTYLAIPAGFEVVVGSDETRIDLDRPARVLVGARAARDAPTATVTVTDDPTDLLAGVGRFGTALQSHSPERSFGSLRGHPPRLRVGDAFEADRDPPDAGVTIEAPATREAAYAVAPLAYYLAADVVPADRLAIRADGAAVVPDVDGRHLADVAGDLLRHCLTLDCVVRTAGLYPVDLAARDELAERGVDLDRADLYDAPLAERTRRYLDVPREPVAAVAPTQPVAAVVEPGREATEALPFLVDRLATVRAADPPRYTGTAARAKAARTFATDSRGAFTRGAAAGATLDGPEAFVDLPGTDADRTVWVGEGVPFDAAKYLRAGVDHRLDRLRDPSAGALDVTVVCNEAAMDVEVAAVRDAYDVREDRPFELTVRRRLGTAALREVIESGTDLFHFVGHATPAGLECPDGTLDVATVAESRVDAFVLNACESFHPGRELVAAGSVGGVVTYTDVSDRRAVEAGANVARLLDAGFPLGAAREVVRSTVSVGGQYLVVGDESAVLVQPEGGPAYLTAASTRKEGYRVRHRAYTSTRWGTGSLFESPLDPTDRRHLTPGDVGPFEPTPEAFESFLAGESGPVLVDGEFAWESPEPEPEP